MRTRLGRTKAFAGLMVLAACAGPDPSSTSTPTPTATPISTPTSTPASTGSDPSDLVATTLVARPGDVDMFFDYPRYLWHLRRLSVATTNLGDEPISISSIAVRADHFEPVAPEPKRTVIAPGQRIDVQVDFGDLTTCEAPPARDAAVLVALSTGDADPVTYLVPLDPAPLDEIRDRECAQRRVTDAASIEFSADRVIDGTVMTTAIEIVRSEGDPVIELTSLSGSVIFAVVAVDPGEPVARVAPGVAHLDVPIRIEVTRCDPHVVSQSSRTFDLAVYVSVDSADTHRHQLAVDSRLQTELQSMIDQCAAS